MNKTTLFEILQKLGAIATYAELLPSDFKPKFLEDIESVKKKVTDAANEQPSQKEAKSETPVLAQSVNITDTSDSIKIPPPPVAQKVAPPPPPPMAAQAPPPPPPPQSQFTQTGTFMSFKKTFEAEKKAPQTDLTVGQFEEEPSPLVLKPDIPQKPTFSMVMGFLIPKLTDEGKKMMGDLSLPIEHYKTLKLIDGTSTFFDLFSNHVHNYKNFIHFASLIFQFELDKYVYFVKNQSVIQNRGWVRLGEIFCDSKVVSELNVSKAATYQKNKRGMFIGEAMVELKFINDDELRNGLKIQRWISRLCENSLFIKPAAGIIPTTPQQADKTASASKSFSNILDFIIPVFNSKVNALFNDPNRKDLVEKLKIIDGESSIIQIFNKYSESFRGDKLALLRFLFKLEGQDLLFYKKNSNIQERNIWIKFGELLISLDLITNEQLEYALNARTKNEKLKNSYIGEVFAELKYITTDILEETLKIQRWCNAVLAKISYENAFVSGIESVLKTSFNCPVEIGGFRKMAFPNPLEGMICIIYPISGNLNGYVYYIMDQSFMNNLSSALMASYGMTASSSPETIDESIVAEISSMITGSSLTKLSTIGLACETTLPKIIMGKEIIIAEKKPISVIPLMNQWGRFAIGLEISD